MYIDALLKRMKKALEEMVTAYDVGHCKKSEDAYQNAKELLDEINQLSDVIWQKS